MQPDLNTQNPRQTGYIIHTHCWLLLDRVIGRQFIEGNLRIFVRAVEQLWRESSHLWELDRFDEDYDDPFHPRRSRASSAPQIAESEHTWSGTFKRVDTFVDSVNEPEIQALIEQGHR